MSEDESDSELLLDPSRLQVIDADAKANLDVLCAKTVNFEDLLNLLVRKGCLSFEEKFKILSGIVDQNTSNKTVPEKCHELYPTLIRKQISWAKILRCWEETGNDYLYGRFDTHFTIEGRDSKSLKFSKFKALPSHRTEFLTHLTLKNLQLSPKNLLKCLRKSSRLESITLERIKVPYGGRGDDPSSDFDQPLILPNLRNFYLEEITPQDKFESIKDVNMYLDEINLKPMLFFGLNPNMTWDAGISIHFRIREATIFKMSPPSNSTLISTLNDDDDKQGCSSEFTSMLRRRPTEYGGFINPENSSRVHIYECYVPKVPFTSSLTHLVVYRCRLENVDQLVSTCPNLVQVSIFGELETQSVSRLDLAAFKQSEGSLRDISLGFIQITYASEPVSTLALNLTSLTMDCCRVDEGVGGNLDKRFQKIDNLNLIVCSGKLLASFYQSELVDCISLAGYGSTKDFDDDDTGSCNELMDALSPKELKDFGKDFSAIFTFEKNSDSGNWSGKKRSGKDALSVLTFETFHWGVFCDLRNRNIWFELPFKKTGNQEEDNPRYLFRNSKMGC